MKFQTVLKEKPEVIPGRYEGIYDPLNINQASNQESEVQINLNLYPTTVSNKQYRPFSNIANVPPIENPIILNPNYKDVLFNPYATDNTYKEQHNGTDKENEIKRREKELAVKTIVEKLKHVQSRTKDNRFISKLQKQDFVQTVKNEEIKKKEIEFKKKVTCSRGTERKIDKDVNIQSIKMTALNIIDENIKKAVSVAEQIKKEIDVELTGRHLTKKETKSTDKFKYFTELDKKFDSRKTFVEKQAYSLGSQTIPYMKNYLQSKHFNNVLIKKIFLQLTKFMVSLSRHLSTKSTSTFFESRDKKYYGSTKSDFEMDNTFIDDEEGYEEKILSGSEMSRKFGKTPLEFTRRMDTVITEFEARTGIEQTSKIQRRSRSRSRSTVKERLVNGDLDDHVYTDADGKNIYRAFVTEEWSEYYDLGKPETITTTKSEKHSESTIMKKETIEKLFEEKITQKETPLTYVAIVQAHVFTNQDAIIRDSIQKTEHEESKMIASASLESKKESMIIKKEEQTASFTDLEHQVIRINKEKPIEKVVVVESIEDITPVEEYKSITDVEKGVTGFGIQKTTEVMEPITEIKSERPVNLIQARTSVEASTVSIAGSEAIIMQEEKDNTFILPQIKSRKSITLFEAPLKNIAQTTEIDTIEPRVEILEIFENKTAMTTEAFEAPIKSIAQTSEIQIIEPQFKPLELKISKEENLKELVEMPVQPVAVNMETYILQPNVDIIETPQLKMEQTKISVEPLSKTVAKTSEVYIDEVNTITFEKQVTPSEHTKLSLASPHAVAQKMETYLDETSVNLGGSALHTQAIRESFEEPIKIVAEMSETSTDVAELSIFKKDSVIGENTKTSIETPMQLVAQVGEINTGIIEGLYEKDKINMENTRISIETPLKIIAQKHEISTEEANVAKFEKMHIQCQNLISKIETPVQTVAETSETIITENSSEFEVKELIKENIEKSMEPMKSVAETGEIYVNDIGQEFDKFKATGTTPEFLIEAPIRIIAETNETVVDESVGNVEKIKLITGKIQSNIETPSKTVAEVSLTLMDEASGTYEKGKLPTQSPLVSIESSVKTVAEISEPLLNDTSDNLIKKPTSLEIAPNSSIEITFKSVANKTEVSVDENYIKNLEKLETTCLNSQTAVETSFKVIPEISEVTLNETSIETDTMKYSTESSKIVIETPLKTVAEKTEPFIADVESDTLKLEKYSLDQSYTSIEMPIKTVAEKLEMISDEPKLESLSVEGRNTGTSKVSMEDSLRFLAETNLPAIEGPSTGSLNVPKITYEEAKITLDKVEPLVVTHCVDEGSVKDFEKLELQGVKLDGSIEITFKVLPEISQIALSEVSTSIETPKCPTMSSKILVETPLKTVAEKIETFVETVDIQRFESEKRVEDLSHLSFETPTKAVAENAVVITSEPIANVLKIEEIKSNTPKTSMEDSLRFLAEAILPVIEEPRTESLQLPKLPKEEAKIALDKIEPTIISEVILTEPNQVPFEVAEIKQKTSQALLEESQLVVPEILTTYLEGPKDDVLFVPKAIEEYAKINLRKSEATSVTEISILEPQCNSLEVPEIKKRQSHPSLEDIKMTVPNIETNITLGPKDDFIVIPSIVKENANLKVNELKALETSLITSEEVIQKAIEQSKIDAKQSKMFVEDYVKTVAESAIVEVEESENRFSTLSEAIGQAASLTIQSLAALAQTAVIPVEEVKVTSKHSETSSNKAKVFVQELAATNIAQTIALSSVIDENFQETKDFKKVDTKIETFETVKATLNKVDVQESKLEISEIIDDKSVYEDVSVDYDVELAKEDIHAEISRDEYAEFKIAKKQSVETQEASYVARKSRKQAIKKQEVSSSAVLELDTEYIKKDIEYMENGMASIIQSVDADLQSKSYAKSLKDEKLSIEIISEAKSAESSKSPSPTSPIIDVYLFNVATPYVRHEEEIPSVELDYRPIPQKRRYTQAEISIAESIGIKYEISDSEEEQESIEDYEYHVQEYETAMNTAVTSSSHSKVGIEETEISHIGLQNKHMYNRSDATLIEAAKTGSKEIRMSHSANLDASISHVGIAEMSRTSELMELETGYVGNMESTEQALEIERSVRKRKSTKQVAAQSTSEMQIKNTQLSEAITSESMEVDASYERNLDLEMQSKEQDSEIKRTASKRKSKKHVVAQSTSEMNARNIETSESMGLDASYERNTQLEMQSKYQALEFESSASKRKSTSKRQAANIQSLQASSQMESNETYQTQSVMESHSNIEFTSENIESLELNRQSLQADIKVMETDIESRHALLAFGHEAKSEITKSSKEVNRSEIKELTEAKSPSLTPPTPLTDEYVFRLSAPLPSREGTPVPRDCTSSSESEEEVVRRKLIPYIEPIESTILEPSASPTSPVSSPTSERRKPVYTKPGLRGGGDKLDFTKEEILEIERKSTLLASAIDRTIKSIEEYKSEVGLEPGDMEYHSSSSEIITTSSSSESTVRECKTINNDNKVDVLIDKMVETSRRCSGEGIEQNTTMSEEFNNSNASGGKEIVIPIVKEYTEPDVKSEKSTDHTTYQSKDRRMDKKLSQQLLESVQNMIDPNASIEERLAQMQAQIAELSQLPDIINRTLETVKSQFQQLNYEVQQKSVEIQVSQSIRSENVEQIQEQTVENSSVERPIIIEVTESEDGKDKGDSIEMPSFEQPDMEIQRIIEKRRLEAENKAKEEIMKERLSQELRIAAERLSPKLGLDEKPKLGFAEKLPKHSIPATASAETVKPSSGKIWKKLDNYDDANLEQMLSETLSAQAEVIKGNAIGVNFMKYEKPQPGLEHLQNSEVYKAIHEVDQKPLKKVELLKPAIAASDYVERLRSVSPSPVKTLIEDCEV